MSEVALKNLPTFSMLLVHVDRQNGKTRHVAVGSQGVLQINIFNLQFSLTFENALGLFR